MHLAPMLAAVTATTISSPRLAASPSPTAPAVLELRDLAAREIGANTCGWVDGVESRSLTCNSGRDCLYFTASSALECCPSGEDCTPQTSCIDYASACVTCASNSATLTCGPSNRYCALIRAVIATDRYTMYDCYSSSSYTRTVRLSYSGQDLATLSYTPRFTSAAARSSSSTSSSATSSPTDNGGSPAVPVAVIAGATVGGVLGLAGLIAFVTLLICCMRRRGPRGAPPPAHAPPQFVDPNAPPPPQVMAPIPEFHGPYAERSSVAGPAADHKLSMISGGASSVGSPATPSLPSEMGSPALPPQDKAYAEMGVAPIRPYVVNGAPSDAGSGAAYAGSGTAYASQPYRT